MRSYAATVLVPLIAVALFVVPCRAVDEPLPAGALVRLGSSKFRLPQGAAALVFSPDSKWLLSGDNQGTIQAWDVVTGQVARQWRLSQANVMLMRFSPDATRLAVSYADGAVYVMDPVTGRTVFSQGDRRYDPVFFAWTPDSKTLLLCRREGRVQHIDAATWREVKAWTFGMNTTASIACSPDGKTVMLQGYDGNVRGVDLQSGKETTPFEKLGPDMRNRVRGGNSLTYTPDGKQVLGAFSNQAIPVWDAKTGKIARRFQLPPNQYMYNVAVSANGRFAAAVMQNDGSLRVWGIASGEELRTLDTTRLNPYAMAFSPDGRMLGAVVGQSLRIWDLATGKDMHDDGGHRGMIHSLTFLENGSKLVTMGQDLTLRYWDTATGKELRKARMAQYGGQSMAADASGKAALYYATSLGLHRWSPATSADPEPVPMAPNTQNFYFQFSADGRFAAGTQNNNELVVIDTTNGAERHRLNPAGRIGYNPLPSPGGRYVAYISSFMPGTVLIWDFAAGYGKRPLIADGPNRGAARMAFSRDGRLLAVQTQVGIVQLWEIATATPLAQIASPDGYNIMAMAISPDARTVATSSTTGAIRLFDVVSGKSVGPLTAHSAYVPAMAFSADGTRLATGSLDTTAVVWDVAKLTESFPRPTTAAPTESQLEESWTRLAHSDGQVLWPAMDRLVSAPDQAVALLREKLKPEPAPDLSQVDRWVGELGHARFAVRDKATRSLAALGGRIGPNLAAALQAGPSPEARRRLEGLLQTLRDGISIKQLRPLRAVEVLERINTPSARQVLETYANQTGEDDLKREAEDALKRMAK